MNRYHGVHGGKRVKLIAEAIEASGATLLVMPKASEAPFEFKVRTGGLEELSLIVYAFTANEYRQGGRPADEHRFQIKYGSDFQRPHSIFIDPQRRRLTLMLGVHVELPLFIGVDPAMHNPTWFSSSVEFKRGDLDLARINRWHGWERDRVGSGRRRVDPRQDLRAEVLVAFRPEHFITYALFERVATGMDPGERLRLADRISGDLKAGRNPDHLLEPVATDLNGSPDVSHPLLKELGLSASELMAMLGGRFRLMAAVRGGVAEHHLDRFLRSVPGIARVVRFDQDGQPDFEVGYRKRRVRIECKNVLRRKVGGAPRVDFQKTRASKADPCSRYYERSHFEILAACLHPITERWEFQFCRTASLSAHPTCSNRLSPYVAVAGEEWTPDIRAVLDEL